MNISMFFSEIVSEEKAEAKLKALGKRTSEQW